LRRHHPLELVRHPLSKFRADAEQLPVPNERAGHIFHFIRSVSVWDISHIIAQIIDLGYVLLDISQILVEYSKRKLCEEKQMNAKDAVARRIIALCKERTIAVNALANLSGVSPSTIYSMLNTKSQNPGVVSLKKLCDGLEITLREFFDSDLFDGLEQEIK
jgi:DNA-binding Xre family transcriptional regulator